MLNQIIDLGISKREALELIKVSKNIKKDIKKLKKGYPIQYLIKYTNFYGNKINVNKNVLIPRYETEYLVEKTIEYIKKYNMKNPFILDLCTGSGAIAIAIKNQINSNVVGSDISRKALKVAKKNSKQNNTNIKFVKSNLFNKINTKFDIIISNPPYISKTDKIEEIVLKNEPNLALFSPNNGIHHIEQIIKQSKNHLNQKSIIAFEIGESQEKELKEIALTNYPNSKISFEKDLTGKTRYLFIFNKIE